MALPLSPKLAKMLKSLSVLASRCNVRVDTRWREGKVEGNSVGYPGAIRVIIIGNIINYCLLSISRLCVLIREFEIFERRKFIIIIKRKDSRRIKLFVR